MKFDLIRNNKFINMKFEKFLFELLDNTKPSDFSAKRRIDMIPGFTDKMKRSVEKNRGYYLADIAAVFPITEIGKCCNNMKGYGNPKSVKIVDGKAQTDFVVTDANYCGDRFCSICTAKDSRIKSLHLEFMWDRAIKENKYTFLFLTLSVPNSSEGFRKSCDYMQKAVNKIIKRMGYESKNNTFSAIAGIYGQYEVTIEAKKKTDDITYWHPHLHLLIAYKNDCIKDMQVAYSGKIKSIDVWTNKCKTNLLHFDNNTIRLWWYDYLQEVSDNWFPKYSRDGKTDMSKIGYQVQFQPVKDRNDGKAAKELSKYLTRLFDINSTEDFLRYCIDCHGLHQRIGKGIFRFCKEDKEQYQKWLDEKKQSPEGDEVLPSIGQNFYFESKMDESLRDYEVTFFDRKVYFFKNKFGRYEDKIGFKGIKENYSVGEDNKLIIDNREDVNECLQLELESELYSSLRAN